MEECFPMQCSMMAGDPHEVLPDGRVLPAWCFNITVASHTAH